MSQAVADFLLSGPRRGSPSREPERVALDDVQPVGLRFPLLSLLDEFPSGLLAQLGEPRVESTGPTGCAVVWPRSGGLLEVRGEEGKSVHWFLVDPWARLYPEEGYGLLPDARAALLSVLDRWDARLDDREPRALSPVEFEVWAKGSDRRMELVDGQIYAMAGSTPRHDRIAVNLNRLIDDQTAGSKCRGYSADRPFKAKGWASHRYPDLSIVCGPLEYEPGDSLYQGKNPTVLFEIVSPSSRQRDHEEKAVEYPDFPTLRHYVIAETLERKLTVWTRGDGGWTKAEYGPGGAVTLEQPELTLALDEVYKRIEEEPG